MLRMGVAVTLIAGMQASRGEDLLDVYREALGNDPQYLSAGAANRATRELRPQALAALLPNASFNAETRANSQNVRTLSGAGGRLGVTNFNSTSLTVSLTQPVFRKELLIQLSQADTRVKQANADYAAALQDLVLRVAERFFGVLSALDDLKFAQSTRDANEQQLRQSRQRFDVGLIAITDVEEAKAGHDLAEAQVIDAQNLLDNAREAMREVTGRYLPALALLGDRLPLIAPDPQDIDAWTRTALVQNWKLLATGYAADSALTEIKVREARHLPTVDVIAQRNVSKSGGGFGRSNIVSDSVALAVNVPIFSGGLVLSQTREARHRHRQALDDLERERRVTQRQARDAYRGVISGISQVKALAQAVVSNNSALEAIEAGFQVGTRTSVDVLQAQSALFGAQRNYARSRYDYILDILRLKQAAGTLSEKDLAEINRWLE